MPKSKRPSPIASRSPAAATHGRRALAGAPATGSDARILIETSYVSVQGNVRRLNHRFPLFELAFDEGRGVERRAATRFDSLFGDQFITSGTREVAIGDGVDRLQDVGRRACPRQQGEPCGCLERRVD